MKALLIVISVVLFSCNKEVVNSPIKRSPEQLKEVSISLQKETFPLDAISYSVCTQEAVHLTGDIQLTFIVKQIDNILNITANWIYNVFGVGQTSGTQYKLVGHQTSLEKFDINTSLTEFLNYNRKTILVTAGSNNNMTIIETHRLILDADGQIKVQFDRVDINSCQ